MRGFFRTSPKLKSLMAALFALSGLILALLLAGGCGSGSKSEEAGSEAPENALREISKEGYERRASFEVDGEEAEGGEARRGGPNSPAAQSVADRAYPRTYVSDRRAKAT